MPDSKFDEAVSFFSEELDTDPAAVNGKAYVLFPVSVETDPDDILELQDEARSRGAFLFLAEPPTGDDDYSVGLAPVRDAFAAIESVGTAGPRGAPSTAEIIAWLKETDATDPLVIDLITEDGVGGNFVRAVKNPRTLATRLYNFCPLVYESLAGNLESDPEAAEALGLPSGVSWHDPVGVLTAALAADTSFFLFWN